MIDKSNIRNDIQSLRGIAVLLVLLSHSGIEQFQGGYLGVDVFFVISGFVITLDLIPKFKLLHVGSTKLYFRNFLAFYIRRFFRLFPLAFFVVITTFIGALMTLNSLQVKEFKEDGLWALSGLFNWHLIDLNTEYFNTDADKSAFLHFWSLAIEEQFYAFYPFFLFLILCLITKYSHRTRFSRPVYFILPIGIMSVISLFAGVSIGSSSGGELYLSTYSRIWELGLGCICAFAITTRLNHIRILRMKHIKMVLISSIIFLSFLSAGESAYNLLAAISVTFLTFVFLMAPVHERKRHWLHFENNRILILLGYISYGVYLWHWPIIVFSKLYFPSFTSKIYGTPIILLISIVVALFSSKYIENPFRFLGQRISRSFLSDDLTKNGVRSKRSRRGFKRLLNLNAELIIFLLIVTMVGVIYQSSRPRPELKSISFQSPNLVNSDDLSTIPSQIANPKLAGNSISSGEGKSESKPYSTSLQIWKLKISQSNKLVSVPAKMRNAISTETSRGLWDRGACKMASTELSCSAGNGDLRAMFLGDSHGVMLHNTVLDSLTNLGYRTDASFFPYCKFAKVVPINQQGKPVLECSKWVDANIERIKKQRPSLLVLSQYNRVNLYSKDQVLGEGESRALLEKATINILKEISPFVGKIVIIGETPHTNSLKYCMSPTFELKENCFAKTESNKPSNDMEKRISSTLKTEFIDMNTWLCIDDLCPPIIGDLFVYIDGNHLTESFASSLRPLFESYLQSKVL